MTLLRTTLVLRSALLALAIPTAASARPAPAPPRPTRPVSVQCDPPGIHGGPSHPSGQRRAALRLQRDVRATASGVLAQSAGHDCNLLAFERLYGPTQTAPLHVGRQTERDPRPLALTAVHTWYSAVDSQLACAA